jgi:hypothetical protein
MSLFDFVSKLGAVRDEFGQVHAPSYVNVSDMVDESGNIVSHNWTAPVASSASVRDTTPPPPLPQENLAPSGVTGQVYSAPSVSYGDASTVSPGMPTVLLIAGGLTAAFFLWRFFR